MKLFSKLSGILPLALVSIVIFSVPSCSLSNNSNSKNADQKNESDKNIIINPKMNETAKFLAGAGSDIDKNLSEFSKGQYYKTYSTELNSSWTKFQKPNLQKIDGWWKKFKPSESYKNVLYPFSGPDIMNALVFYPDAKKYIMFGLEAPGKIPDPQNLNRNEIMKGLTGLRRSLGTILHVNFFRTEGMAKELGSDSFNSIAGLIIYFLSTNGYEILNAKNIAVDADGNLSEYQNGDEKIKWEHPPASKRIPGVEIVFRKNNSEVKTVRYFMLNVIDEALEKNSPNFIKFIEKEGRYATVLKSASYLMHNDKFSKIRSTILSSTDFLVQDDSGAPLKFFNDKEWKVAFHGFYERPIPLFGNRYQKELKDAFKTKSTGILPFSYGYDYQPGQSNLMTAERNLKK